MSSIRPALKTFPQLQPEDIRILEAIETKSKQYRYVPEEQICLKAKLPKSEVQHRLSRLVTNHLVRHRSHPYRGYHLMTAGHDCLVLDSYVKANVISAVGRPLGVGKEADVYRALTPIEQQVVIKFHRLGRISFKQTKRKRNYTQQYTYASDWHQQSTTAARKEYRALKLLEPHSIAAPKPIFHNRHSLVMTLINGAPLNLYPKIPTPQRVLGEILNNIKKTYQKAKIVHGDLSPYNVLIQPDLHIFIVDWPQYVYISHPNAQQLLKRDLEIILKFFKKKEKLVTTLTQALAYVKEGP